MSRISIVVRTAPSHGADLGSIPRSEVFFCSCSSPSSSHLPAARATKMHYRGELPGALGRKTHPFVPLELHEFFTRELFLFSACGVVRKREGREKTNEARAARKWFFCFCFWSNFPPLQHSFFVWLFGLVA